jgi:hypothetical protein
MHSSTKQTSFFFNYGLHPQADPFQVKDVESLTAEDLAVHLVAIHDKLAFQLYEAQDCYKDYVDWTQKIHPNFHIGNQAWLLQRNIQTKWLSRKLEYQQFDPFKNIAQVNLVSYGFELLPTRDVIMDVFGWKCPSGRPPASAFTCGRGFTHGRGKNCVRAVKKSRPRGHALRGYGPVRTRKKFKILFIYFFVVVAGLEREKKFTIFGFRFSIPKIPELPKLRGLCGRSREKKKVFSA